MDVMETTAGYDWSSQTGSLALTSSLDISTNTTSVLSTTVLETTNGSTTTPKRDSRPDPTEVDRYLWIYWSPITFTVGILGNLFVLLVLRIFWKHGGRDKRSTSRTITVYLSVMAVADIIFIISGIVPEWLEAMEYVNFGEISPMACKFEKFVFYTSGDVAIWIIVVFNVDRFIAVCFPLKQNCKCVRKCLRHPVLLSSVVTALACVKNLHVFWTRGAVRDDSGELISNCGRPEPFTYFEEYVRPWVAFILVSLVPSIVIIICNISIIVTLKRASKLRSENSSAESGFLQTIFMCMSASIAFLLCITPSMVIYIGRAYWTDPDDPENNPYGYDIAKAVNNQLVYVNHSINFFLYCTTGKRFRNTFKMMLLCSSKEAMARNKTWNVKTMSHSRTATSSNGNTRRSPNRADGKQSELSVIDVTSANSVVTTCDVASVTLEPPRDDITAANHIAADKQGVVLTANQIAPFKETTYTNKHCTAKFNLSSADSAKPGLSKAESDDDDVSKSDSAKGDSSQNDSGDEESIRTDPESNGSNKSDSANGDSSVSDLAECESNRGHLQENDLEISEISHSDPRRGDAYEDDKSNCNSVNNNLGKKDLKTDDVSDAVTCSPSHSSQTILECSETGSLNVDSSKADLGDSYLTNGSTQDIAVSDESQNTVFITRC